MPKLTLVMERKPVRVFEVNSSVINIGRAEDMQLMIDDASVSRRHAKIIRSGTDYHVLEEVGTVNGTYVNEQRIPTGAPVNLHNGDLLKIGLVAMKAVFD